MKVSEEKKQQTRQEILKSAVEVITEKGFNRATMNEIARKADVGGSTIYNYFPNKESLMFAYFEDKQIEVLDLISSIADFDNFSLQERLQVFLESLLDGFEEDREFILEVFHRAFFTPMISLKEMRASREIFLDTVRDFVNQAVENGEIEELALRDIMLLAFWEYYIGILAYWLKDDSEDYTNTTQLIDQSIEIIAMILNAGIIGKFMDLGTFFYRIHIYGFMERWSPKRGPVFSFVRDIVDGNVHERIKGILCRARKTREEDIFTHRKKRIEKRKVKKERKENKRGSKKDTDKSRKENQENHEDKKGEK